MPNAKYTPVAPARFNREDLPGMSSLKGVSDLDLLKVYDGKVNGGVLYHMLSCGLFLHAKDFVSAWLKMPDYGDGDIFYRFWHINHAFSLSHKDYQARNTTDSEAGEDSPAMTKAGKLMFREQLIRCIMLPQELLYAEALTDSDGGSMAGAAAAARAMERLSRPMMDRVPTGENLASFLNDDEMQLIATHVLERVEAFEADLASGESETDIRKRKLEKVEQLNEALLKLAIEEDDGNPEELKARAESVIKTIKRISEQKSDGGL